MMRCFRCGTELEAETRYCPNCGVRASDPHADTVMVAAEGQDDLLERVRLVFAGEYEVERELARGGMAVVYQAMEPELRRSVALKVLPPDLGLTPRATERFKREARMVAALDHPNIIPVYRVGQLGGISFIVMKFIEGRTLDAILAAQGALPIPVVLAVLRAATRGLAFAHGRDIVHRDVKSANILVDVDGRVMLSDFGIALRAADVTLTAVGTVMGTPAFMSPEQCAGHRAGPQSDQYSLGVVAFQLLTGAVPFTSETLAGIMQHDFFTPVPDMRRARDDVPRALGDLVQRALAKEEARRFATTREMLAAVEAIPFSETDRLESEQILRDLARGGAVPRVDTRPLPPLMDGRTLPLVPLLASLRTSHPARRLAGLLASLRTSHPARRLAGLLAVAVLAVGAVWWTARAGGAGGGGPGGPDSAATRAAAASTLLAAVKQAKPPPAPLAPAVAPLHAGKLRMLTSPATAEILVDGRKVGEGSLLDLRVPVGARRVVARAPGYDLFDTTVVVAADSTVSLGRITLRSRGAPGP